MKSLLLTAVAATAITAGAVEAQSRLDTVKDRGTLLCSGHNGSYLGFAEVDDQGNWRGFDIDFCRGLAAALPSSTLWLDFRSAPAFQAVAYKEIPPAARLGRFVVPLR